MACVKTLRTECRVGHVLRLETRLTRGDSWTVEGTRVLQDTWTEEEVMGKSLDCEERDEEELCAPINCKHVNITHVCFDQVTVRCLINSDQVRLSGSLFNGDPTEVKTLSSLQR